MREITIVPLNRRHLSAALLLMMKNHNPALYAREVNRLKERGEKDMIELLKQPDKIKVIA